MTTCSLDRIARVAAVLAILGAPLASSAAGSPDQSCRAAKLKAAGKYASALLGCHAKAAIDGSVVDAECLSKAAGKLTSSYGKADTKSGTPCDGLRSSASSDAEALAADVLAAAPALAGGGKCPSSVYKSAGKRASGELGAWSKFVTSGDATKRDASIAKASTKLADKIAKAETSDGCMGSGQTTAVETAVQEGIEQLIECLAETGLCVETETEAEAGETVSTDDGSGPTAGVPLTASVRTPNAGTVVLRVGGSQLPPPSGYGVLGQEVEVTAPGATAAVPLVLTFTIDASLLPGDPFTVTLTRNGAVLADCTGAPDVADPDPCVQSRLLVAGGDLRIVALSSHASFWAPVVPLGPTTTVTTTTITTSTTLPPVANHSMRWQMRADKVGSDVASELDIGWRGMTHDIDPVDGSAMTFGLDCPSASPPSYGDCTVTGFDASEGNCRCSNNSATVCDEPYAADADNCGGATCVCYTRPPIPAVTGGTPICLVGIGANDASGTWNPDTGSGAVTLNENLRLHLGSTLAQPCPACVGDATPNDGTRGGTCDFGATPGAACDANGTDPTYPSPGGGATSIDCLPSPGGNISGPGMKFPHVESTSAVSLPAAIPCVGSPSENCPCAMCSSDITVACSSDAQCLAQLGRSCSVDPAESCTTNSDCAAVNEGTCHSTFMRCTGAFNVLCTTNADCASVNVGPCVSPTCSTSGSNGTAPRPNSCSGSCDVGVDGEGECSTGPFHTYCDGFLEEDGKGIVACFDNADCGFHTPPAGTCTVSEASPCFADPITATGIADSDSPRTVAALCVTPTASSAANSASGLPGPARLRSDWTVTYE